MIGVVDALIIKVATVANATGSGAAPVVGGGAELEVESTPALDLGVLVMPDVLIVFGLLLVLEESILDVGTGLVDIALTVVDGDDVFVVSLTLVEATTTCVGGFPQGNVPHEESPLKQYPAGGCGHATHSPAPG